MTPRFVCIHILIERDIEAWHRHRAQGLYTQRSQHRLTEAETNPVLVAVQSDRVNDGSIDQNDPMIENKTLRTVLCYTAFCISLVFNSETMALVTKLFVFFTRLLWCVFEKAVLAFVRTAI